MASTAPKIANLDRERFDRLNREIADRQARLDSALAAMDDYRRAYSRAHGFRINLSAEQVRRDLEFRAAAMGEAA